ncbi:MAG: ATP-binding protein [Pseudomonas sp.]
MSRWAGCRSLPALPAMCALALVLLAGSPRPAAAVALFALVLGLTWVALRQQRRHQRDHLRTLGNLLDALREGDYAVRGAARDGDTGSLTARFNALAARLQDEHRAQQESLHLLGKTLAALDGAVFAFEGEHRLRLVNPAGERLLARPATQLLGRGANELGLASLFALPSGSIHAHAFAGAGGRWQVGHAALRSRSQSGRLLVLQPVERALRAEEAQAFRRLLRVLGHEINNSLAPIASMADTLGRLLPPSGTPLDAELQADLRGGLGLIEQRSQSLQRFLGGYARLARLPAPQPAALALAPLCERVARLVEAEVVLEIEPGLWLHADADQLEQVLINLLRNAHEAGGAAPVRLRAYAQAGQGCVQVIDAGGGLPASDSLFVPFFTTKAGGSGIGLVLSRQIVEAQGGTLTVAARQPGPGTLAQILLPLRPDRAEQAQVTQAAPDER